MLSPARLIDKLHSQCPTPGRDDDSLCVGVVKAVKVHEAILDGKLVCLDDGGRPMVDALMYRRQDPCVRAIAQGG